MKHNHLLSLTIAISAIAIALAVMLLSTAMVPTALAQGGPTDQQQTIQAIIDQRFAETAHPQTPNGSTQTAQAQRDNGATTTAAFNSTVNAQFNQAMEGTAQAGLTELFRNDSGFTVRYPNGWLAKGPPSSQNSPTLVAMGTDQAAANAALTLSALNFDFQSGQMGIAFIDATRALQPGLSALDTLKQQVRSMPQSWQASAVTPIHRADMDAAQVDIASVSPGFEAQVIFILRNKSVTAIFAVTAPGELAAKRVLINAIAFSIKYVTPAVAFPPNLGDQYRSIPAGITARGPAGPYPVGFPYLGSPDAPVKIEEIGSYSCTFCQAYHNNIALKILDEIKSGRVQYIYIPTTTTGDFDPTPGTEAAYCAMQQNQFWSMHDILYDWQVRYAAGAADRLRLRAAAQQLKLDLGKFDACLADPQTAQFISTANTYVEINRQMIGTPTVFIWINDTQIVPTFPQFNTTPGSLDSLSLAELRRLIDQGIPLTPTLPDTGSTVLSGALIRFDAHSTGLASAGNQRSNRIFTRLY